NSMFIACADRVGTEREQLFEGQSVIVSCTGWFAAGPPSPPPGKIIYGRVDLADARRKRNWNEFNQVLRDRRTDVYDEMLGSEIKRGWYWPKFSLHTEWKKGVQSCLAMVLE